MSYESKSAFRLAANPFFTQSIHSTGGTMNLTIEQLSKATKLSVSTIRVYASQRNLGKKIGNKRVFTQADVQKLLKGSKKSPPKKKTKAPVKKTSKRAIKPGPIKVTKPSPISSASPAVAKPVKSSFWSRLFGGKKDQKKVEAKATPSVRKT
jgi:hypothetical protein